MHLPQQTGAFAAWTRQVMGVFLSVRRWTTLGVITTETAGDVAKLIAFFLPLKVILLAGSPGVPRYFPFIDPAHKMPWVIGLTAGVFIAYGFALLCQHMTERLSEGASSDVLEGANEMALSSNQHEQVQNSYTTFCRIFSNGLLIILGGIAIAALRPEVAAFLAGAIALQYAVTAWIVSGDDDLRPGRLKAWVQTRLSGYLDLNVSIIFLLGFLVLLVPYLYGVGGNILLAILTLLMMRQVLGAVSQIGMSAVKLARQRDRINAQVFHDQPQKKREKGHVRNLRDLYLKKSRQLRTNDVLADSGEGNPAADVKWMDSPCRYASTLVVGPVPTDKGERYLQQQIYNPSTRVHLENESFLFRHIDRERLHAPARLVRFKDEPFECQIVDFGQGRALTPKQWKRNQAAIAADILGCQPPAALVAAFRKSNRLLGDRIDERLLDRVEVAVDTAEEANAVAALRVKLPVLRERLAALPLCIDNPDVGQPLSAADLDDQPLLPFWGRWTLEPLGGTSLSTICECDTLGLLPQLAGRRRDLGGSVYKEDIDLAGYCRSLENEDARARYKAALGTLASIVDNLATTRTPVLLESAH